VLTSVIEWGTIGEKWIEVGRSGEYTSLLPNTLALAKAGLSIKRGSQLLEFTLI
jgi:hypothetical protein